MATLADLTIAALRSGHEALSALVRDLSAEDLTRPSGASRWQVSQVLSHLGSGAEIGLAALTASQAGAPAPDRDFNRTVWARWDAMSPAEHARGFLEANQRLVEAYESLDDTTRAQLRVGLGFLPQPVDVATAARFRLNEFALHRWDVEVSFMPHATVAPEAVELLLDHIKSMLGWISKPDSLAGRQATLALRLWDCVWQLLSAPRGNDLSTSQINRDIDMTGVATTRAPLLSCGTSQDCDPGGRVWRRLGSLVSAWPDPGHRRPR